MARPDLIERLDQWAEAGLITAEQAAAIRVHEETVDEHRLPRWVEPVAYLGIALVALALVLFGAQVWDRLATWGQVALSLVVTVILLVVGATLRGSDAAPARRAASFAWLLSVVGVGITAGLVFFEAMDLSEEVATPLTAACAAGAGLLLYLLARTGPQQVGLAGGTVFLVGTLPVVLPQAQPWMVPLLFFSIGLIWLLLTWGGIVRPATTGWILGSLSTLAVGFGAVAVGPSEVMDQGQQAFWSGLGVAVGLGLVFLSTVVDQRALLGLGVLGLVAWIPTTVILLFEGSVAVPVAILVTGVVTLTVVVTAVRRGRSSDA